MPAVIRYLGNSPLPTATTLAEQLVRHRTTLGLSQQLAALNLGVDLITLAKAKRGEREPASRFSTARRVFSLMRGGRRIHARRAG